MAGLQLRRHAKILDPGSWVQTRSARGSTFAIQISTWLGSLEFGTTSSGGGDDRASEDHETGHDQQDVRRRYAENDRAQTGVGLNAGASGLAGGLKGQGQRARGDDRGEADRQLNSRSNGPLGTSRRAPPPHWLPQELL